MRTTKEKLKRISLEDVVFTTLPVFDATITLLYINPSKRSTSLRLPISYIVQCQLPIASKS